MSGNGHTAYFGQMAAPEGEGTQNENNSSQANLTGMANHFSQTILTGMDEGQSGAPPIPRPSERGPTPPAGS